MSTTAERLPSRRTDRRHRSSPSLMASLVAAGVLLVVAVIGSSAQHVAHRPFPPGDYARQPAAAAGEVLPGSNYSHYRFARCNWNGGDVLADYEVGTVREIVHRQLLSMRRHGVQTLRTIIWHMSDPGPNQWGPIPSAGGRLVDPYRANLIAYLTEVRRFGFRRLTLAFGPQWTNDPLGPNYRPAKLVENWHFIESIRPLLKRYGPPETRIDLLNEGAPSDYLGAGTVRRISNYDRRLYALYVRRYGARDVTISVIAPVGIYDAGYRLQNLIDIIRSTGLPQPRWYELHAMLSYGAMVHALNDTQTVLQRNGLAQPIVIGEAPYDDPSAAAAIGQFALTTHRVDEVDEWYHRPGSTCNGSPPYRVDAYAAVPR